MIAGDRQIAVGTGEDIGLGTVGNGGVKLIVFIVFGLIHK